MTSVSPKFQSALRRRLHVGTVLALLLAALSLSTFPSAVLGQAAGGDLGIDCDKPRYNADGKLILDFSDGARQASCEAHRTTALTYAGAVMETANRLRLALQTLPPPVWDDLVDHLRTDDAVADWRFVDAATIARLRALGTAAELAGEPVLSRDGTITARQALGVATHWQAGILARSGIGTDWHPAIRARACGFDAAGNPVPGAAVLVWLDPAAVRDRWTPRMVQRTALAWHERRSDRATARNKVPHVLTAANRLTGPRGRVRNVSGDAAVQACLSTVPTGALAERLSVNRPTERGQRALRCADPDEIGSRKLVWERSSGVFLVPERAVLAGGSVHPDRGEPLLGQNPGLPLAAVVPDPASTTPQPGEFLRQGSTCRQPRTLDAVIPQACPAIIGNNIPQHCHDPNGRNCASPVSPLVPDCEDESTPRCHGMTAPERHGMERHAHVDGTHVRHFRFREIQNDPVEPFRVDWVPVMPDPLDPSNDLGIVVPVGVQHPEWESVTVFCEGALPPSEAPPVPPRVQDWTPTDCPTEWGGSFDYGQRLGYTQYFDYPAGWPKRDEAIRTVDDDCFNPVPRTGSQSRTGAACETVATTTATTTGSTDYTITSIRDRQVADPDWETPDPGECGLPWDPDSGDPDPNHANCGQTAPLVTESYSTTTSHTHTATGTDEGACECPAGWSGSITQERDFRWHNRDWAVPVRHRGRAQWSVGQVGGFYDGSATTDALNRPIGWLPVLSTDPPNPPGMPAFIRLISLTADWHEETNTCRPPVPSPGGGSNNHPVHYRDADGNTYRTNSYATEGGWTRDWSNGVTEVQGEAPHGSKFNTKS